MKEDFEHLPVVVDLDGTLIKTDLLLESANMFMFKKAWSILSTIKWLIKGRAYFKEQLAQQIPIDVTVLPYNQGVIEWILEKRKQPCKIVLATASNYIYAKQIADHLGIFDEVIASTKEHNLKGRNKALALIDKYGEKGFEYIGNDESDIQIWMHSASAHIVSSSPRWIQHIEKKVSVGKVFSSEKRHVLWALKKSLRPYQWVKNILIFIPLLAAHEVKDINLLFHACLGFICFSFTASAAYLINDLIDIENDRHHSSKRKRPFASGDLTILAGWILFPILIVFAFTIAYITLPIRFLIVLAFYFFITLCYSFHFKKILMLDVLILSALYTLRIIAGGSAVSIEPSFWLQGVSLFMFLSLAFIKRYNELKLSKQTDTNMQLKGRGYVKTDLDMIANLGSAAGYMSVMVLGLYIQDPVSSHLYSNPKLIGMACPILLYWISRFWLIANRGGMDEDPIVYAFKDKVSLFSMVLICTIFIVAA